MYLHVNAFGTVFFGSTVHSLKHNFRIQILNLENVKNFPSILRCLILRNYLIHTNISQIRVIIMILYVGLLNTGPLEE